MWQLAATAASTVPYDKARSRASRDRLEDRMEMWSAGNLRCCASRTVWRTARCLVVRSMKVVLERNCSIPRVGVASSVISSWMSRGDPLVFFLRSCRATLTSDLICSSKWQNASVGCHVCSRSWGLHSKIFPRTVGSNRT